MWIIEKIKNIDDQNSDFFFWESILLKHWLWKQIKIHNLNASENLFKFQENPLTRALKINVERYVWNVEDPEFKSIKKYHIQVKEKYLLRSILFYY